MARTVGQFLEGFVLPLVSGGEVRVGKPYRPGEVDAFVVDLPNASVEQVDVDDARERAIADLVVRTPSLVLDDDELYLAAAVHNLLFLEHPQVDSWTTPESRLDRVRESARVFAHQGPAEDRYRLLARHSLLHNLFDLSRTDLLVTWWTGNARYFGQRPPGRLTRWRGVRRVREETSVASYSELLGDPDVEGIVADLVRLSPLTDLMAQPREGPALDWTFAVSVLRDAELARAVAYRSLEVTEGEGAFAAPARMAAALDRFIDRGPVAADLRAVAAFLVHLNALIAVGESHDRDLDAPSAALTTALAPERAARRPRGLATFFALPDAMSRVDERLAEPPGLRQDTRAYRRWRQHRGQVRVALGEGAVEALANRLASALGVPRAPDPTPSPTAPS